MVPTSETTTADVDEALGYLSADRLVALEAGDLERHLRLGEEIESLLQVRSDLSSSEKSSPTYPAPEFSLALSPRHRPRDFGGRGDVLTD